MSEVIEEHTEKELANLLRDKEWRMENLYYVKNEMGEKVKFKMRDAQYIVYKSNHLRDIILKSRQHGITTLKCIDFLDDALFTRNLNCLIIAHIKEDAMAFFEDKIKFAYDNLPELIKSHITTSSDSVREMKFINGSKIVVANSGRSGTWQRLHISELGPMCANSPAKALEVKTGTLNAVHEGAKISIESTAKGNSGLFFDMCEAARNIKISGRKPGPLDFKFVFLPWYADSKNATSTENMVIVKQMTEYFFQLKTKHGIELSDRQKAWYISKWNTQGDDIKSEHPSTEDEAFEQSMEGTYYKREFQKIRSFVNSDGIVQSRIAKVPYSPQFLVNTWWDLGVDDYTCIWFTQTVGRQIHVIDYYENSGEGLQHYAKYLQDTSIENEYRYGDHWAPHDIKVRELGSGARTRLDIALDLGIKFNVCASKSVDDGIELVRQLLGVCWFDEEKCSQGLKHLEAYRKRWNKVRGMYDAAPLHNEASHCSDAFRVMACSHEFHYKIKKKTRGPVKVVKPSTYTYDW